MGTAGQQAMKRPHYVHVQPTKARQNQYTAATRLVSTNAIIGRGGAVRREAVVPRAQPWEARHPTFDAFELVGLTTPAAYMAKHSRSFRFASLWMPARDRQAVARVYAWCRFADDIVDQSRFDDRATRARLDVWLAKSHLAYAGHPSGIALVDDVMRDMRERDVPFSYAEALVEGVACDLGANRYDTFAELDVYAYRVAGVVGQWLTRLFGVHNPWMLDRAATLGRAMQLTNIARDVGEDLDRGRIYLPIELLDAHDLCVLEIAAMRRGAIPIDRRYRDAIEDLLCRAESDYRNAASAVLELPRGFRSAVAIASSVYEGIHSGIRQSGYDNLARRAAVSPTTKMTLAMHALWSLKRERARRSMTSHSRPARHLW